MERNLKYIFAMGLYRSGTNFLQQLVDNNFEGNQENIQKYVAQKILYKHCLHEKWYNKIPNDVEPVIIFKNPYQWIDSLVRQSYDLELYYNISYEQYHTPITLKYCNPQFENHFAFVECSVEKLCSLYNEYFNFWFTKNVTFVSHLDVALNQNKYLKLFEQKYNLKRINKKFVGPGIVDGSRPFDINVQQYYIDRKIDNLTSEQIDCITSSIDNNILKRLREMING